MLLLLLFVFSTSLLHAQDSKWFFTLTPGVTVGGPTASLKKSIIKSGCDDKSSFSFLGLSGSIQYPLTGKAPALLVSFGKKFSEHKSWYVTAGLAAAGNVSGLKTIGSFDYFLFSGNYGHSVKIDYKVWQLTAGYQYSFPRTRAKLGFGPTVSLFTYQEEGDKQQHTQPRPAVSGMARLPLGRERKIFGMELFFEAVLAVPAKTASFSKSFEENGLKYSTTLEKGSVSLTQCLAGISFSFHNPVRTSR